MSAENPLLWLPGNVPHDPASGPAAPVAQIGQTYDPFSSRQYECDITPETIARAIRPDYPLERKQALAKKILRNDAQFAASYRNLVFGVASEDWESLPRAKKLRKEQRIAEKVRDYVEQQFEQLPVEQFLQHLLDGEYSPGAWAENQWDLRTKRLTGWEFLDGMRQHWHFKESRYQVLTKESPFQGEALAPNMWAIHTSHLYPGGPLEAGVWMQVLWQYCWKHVATADRLEFAHVFGKPWRLAFVKDPKDLATVIKALRALGVKAAGAFPEGTDVKLEKGAASGDDDIFENLASRADDEVSTLLTGHPLITSAKSGTGTLAGKGAIQIHDTIKKRVSRGLMRTTWRDVVVPAVTFKFGYEIAMEYTSPTSTFKLKYEPPVDRAAMGRAFIGINKALEPHGKAVDPQQVAEETNVTVVDLPEPPAAVVAPDTDPGSSESDAGGEENPGAASRRRGVATRRRSGRALAAAAKERPAVATFEEIDAVGAATAQRAFAELGGNLETAIAGADDSFEAMAAAIWESYAENGPTKRKLASIVRDTGLAAHVAGRGDAHAGD